MQNTTTHWKLAVDDLRSRALDVTSGADARMTARQAARVLTGVVSHVARMSSTDTMQRACAELVRCQPAWATSFRQLPEAVRPDVDQAIQLIVVVCRGMLAVAGADAMRAALAFWATEEDPSVWQQVTGIAA